MIYDSSTQYKPLKGGKGTIKYVISFKSESEFETFQLLSAAGFPMVNPQFEFKQSTAKGRRQIVPQIPLASQIQ